MKIATYSSKVFSVDEQKIYTFGQLSRSSSYTVDEQENGSGKPKLKNKAPGADTMSFSILLKSDYVNVRSEIEDWISMQGKSAIFIIGKEQYGQSKWRLVGVDIADQSFTGSVLSKATLNLSFKEDYVSKKTSTAKNTRNTKDSKVIIARNAPSRGQVV
jgi:hypothetical protein